MSSRLTPPNPDALTKTEYLPTGRLCALYSPVLLVTSFHFRPVSTSSMVMAAPATDAAEGSVTVPSMPPPDVCAIAIAAIRTASRAGTHLPIRFLLSRAEDRQPLQSPCRSQLIGNTRKTRVKPAADDEISSDPGIS